MPEGPVDSPAQVMAPNLIWLSDPGGYAWSDFTLRYANSDHADLYGDAPVVEKVGPNEFDFPMAMIYLSHSMVSGVEYVLRDASSGVDTYSVYAPASDNLAPKGIYDLGLPLVTNGAYEGGGAFPLDGSGDRLRVEGVDVIASKSVWHALLTREGELYWDPAFGNPVSLKDPKPGDLRVIENQLRDRLTRLPLVRRAKVLITFGADNAFLNVTYETTEGATLKEQRSVSNG